MPRAAEGALTRDDLRARLTGALKENGTLDALKKQLRVSVVNELRRSAAPIAKKTAKKGSTDENLHEQGLDIVVLQRLQAAGYACSVSVFAPEAGCTTKPVTKPQALQMLSVNMQSPVFSHICDIDADVLSAMAAYVRDQSQRVSCASGTQTDAESLDEKFRAIDQEYFARAEASRAEPIRSLEERMVAYQRETDARARAEIADELDRFRRVELQRMRLEEQASYASQLEQERARMEAAYLDKLELLRKREADLTSRIDRREREFELHSFQHRQKMLVEIEAARQREADTKATQELAALTAKREEVRLRGLEKELVGKLAVLEQQQREVAATAAADVQRARADMQRAQDDAARQYDSERRALLEDKEALMRERVKLVEALDAARAAERAAVGSVAEAQSAGQAELLREVERLRGALRAAETRADRERAEAAAATQQLGDVSMEMDALRRTTERMSTLHIASRLTDPLSANAIESERNIIVETMSSQLAEVRDAMARERAVHGAETQRLRDELRAATNALSDERHRAAERSDEIDRLRLLLQDQGKLAEGAQGRFETLVHKLDVAQREAEEYKALADQAHAALERERASRRQAESNMVRATYADIPGHLLPASEITAAVGARVQAQRGRYASDYASSFLSQAGAAAASSPTHVKLQRIMGSAVSDGVGHSDGWQLEFNRIVEAMAGLEKEDEMLRKTCSSYLARMNRDRARDLQREAGGGGGGGGGGSPTRARQQRPAVAEAWAEDGKEIHPERMFLSQSPAASPSVPTPTLDAIPALAPAPATRPATAPAMSAAAGSTPVAAAAATTMTDASSPPPRASSSPPPRASSGGASGGSSSDDEGAARARAAAERRQQKRDEAAAAAAEDESVRAEAARRRAREEEDVQREAQAAKAAAERRAQEQRQREEEEDEARARARAARVRQEEEEEAAVEAARERRRQLQREEEEERERQRRARAQAAAEEEAVEADRLARRQEQQRQAEAVEAGRARALEEERGREGELERERAAAQRRREEEAEADRVAEQARAAKFRAALQDSAKDEQAAVAAAADAAAAAAATAAAMRRREEEACASEEARLARQREAEREEEARAQAAAARRQREEDRADELARQQAAAAEAESVEARRRRREEEELARVAREEKEEEERIARLKREREAALREKEEAERLAEIERQVEADRAHKERERLEAEELARQAEDDARREEEQAKNMGMDDYMDMFGIAASDGSGSGEDSAVVESVRSGGSGTGVGGESFELSSHHSGPQGDLVLDDAEEDEW